MAAVQAFTSISTRGARVPGWTPVQNISNRFGPTADPLIYRVGDKFFVPELVRAGNVWSTAKVSGQAAAQLGGKPGELSFTAGVNTYNPYASDYNRPGEQLGGRGWFFESLPDAKKLDDSAEFLPGRGSSNAPANFGLAALIAAPFAAAGLAAATAPAAASSQLAGLMSATGQTASQAAAVASSATSSAVPVGLAAATGTSGASSSVAALWSALKEPASTVLSTAKDAASISSAFRNIAGTVVNLDGADSSPVDANDPMNAGTAGPIPIFASYDGATSSASPLVAPVVIAAAALIISLMVKA